MRCGSAALKIFPEILTSIFEELVFDETYYPPPSEARNSRTQLRNRHPCLPPSHVCRYWRQVALASPRLWGILYASCSRRWFDFISKRAMNVPLILRIDAEFERIYHSGLPMEDCLGRFKEMHLHAVTLYHTSWGVQDIIDGDAPLLEVLEIRMDPIWDSDLLFDINIMMRSDTKPRLRVLRLIGCTVDLSCLFSSTLQELFVDLKNVEPDSHSVSAANLLRSLSKLPSLRSLHLRFVLKSHDSDLESPTSDLIAVQLPHLTHFFFGVSRWTHLRLIQYIVAPKLESLRLHCSQFLDTESVPSTALVTLSPRLPSAPPLRVSLDLNRISRRSVFRAFFSPSPINSTTALGHLTDFQIEFRDDSAMFFERDICLSLPFGQPNMLSVATSPGSTFQTPTRLNRDVLSLLTRVEEVHLGDINALNTFILGTQHIPPPMPLPALRHLTLFSGDKDPLVYIRQFRCLRTMLEQRTAGGAPNIDLTVVGPPETDLDLHSMMSCHVNAFKYIPMESEEYERYSNFA